ncbi:hypothetical protein RHE_CH01357 [Rhizobium etli CFN 42]|uniref:Uncharacterized protein n=1 Tax=Rhizobium etli (strain ATCC 51251 / DSM 11541 / JCM 21823 / NBRC 15573 / CFN 42) TaxID=347834 RepID=Q2KAH6_RHIEC|nr:hypothetical protein RHE_CH01357 [Rhizobium etli CFN 42]
MDPASGFQSIRRHNYTHHVPGPETCWGATGLSIMGALILAASCFTTSALGVFAGVLIASRAGHLTLLG